VRQACVIVFLMLLTPWAAADIATWQGPSSSPNNSGPEPSNSTYDGFILPSNSTITDASFEVSPNWIDAEDNGSLWSSDSSGGFSTGDSNGTSYLTSNGELTLAPISTYGVMTDFETSIPQFGTWSSHGDEFWMPVNLSAVNYGPANASDGHFVAGTNGSIQPGSEGFIRSQFWPLPTVVRYFNLTFDRWNSFDSGDIAEIHYSVDNGISWVTMDNWTGTSTNWTNEQYSLDSLVVNASSIGFRYFVNTSVSSTADVGLFIDSFNLSNQGDPYGTWFHGNSSGAYSANADGTLIIPVNLSGLSVPLEFTYWSNWDIQGGNSDNMLVMISQDNGTSWTAMNPIPGVPGQGIPSGGASYNQQSYGWREIQHPFPSWASTSPNADNLLLQFRVRTDGTTNYGGSSIDGWEGIMIDDLRALSGVGTPSMQVRELANFTNTTGHYLESVQGYPNEWQHVTWEGNNGPWIAADSFELVQELPSGWRVDHIRGSTPWERGPISNSNGFGPNSTFWPSGNKGMAVNLDDSYSNSLYTHLVSPNYYLPAGSTARLTFNHWICTEAAWDGGTVFTSIDDGLTWQHFGNNITGFYERPSQVNSNSPFYGKGIFDGSSVANGCGLSNYNHTFSRVSGDISDLAGNSVRIRFSFFSDEYIEEDGWYIDDAGIVIDRFQSNGTWTSPLIDADESGWARLSSLFEQPEGTNLTVDVIDANGSIIPGHNDLSLPYNLDIAAWEYSQLKFKLKFSTSNVSLTPRVHVLHHGITEYMNLESLKRMDSGLPVWIEDPSLAPPSAEYSTSIDLPNWRPFSSIIVECEGNISASITDVTNRVPILGNSNQIPPTSNQVSLIDEKECGEVLTNPFGPGQQVSLNLVVEGGEEFTWVKLEPVTLRAPISPSVDLGDDGAIDWAWDGVFHHTTKLHSLSVDGVQVSLNDPRGFETLYSSDLEFSILLPSRNLSSLSWKCGEPLNCYNGAINFITNGSDNLVVEESQIWINNSGFEHHMTEYKFSFSSTELTEFKLLSVNYISGLNHTIQIEVPSDDLLTERGDGTSVLSVSISAQRGGIIFDGDIIHERSIIDSWVSIPDETFRPGFSQVAISSHTTILNTPGLESVNLRISTSPSLTDTIAEITIDNLATGGRFIQNSGVGVIALDTGNSSWDGEFATWTLESKWLLDDNFRLYWFASSTNLEDLELGPVMEISGSAQHAASTNDLEVISFNAWANNRSLHDLGNPLWPLNVRGGEEIIVEGEVRYSGLYGINPESGDVDVVISLYEGEQIISNSSVVIGSDGQFNTSLSTPNQGLMSGFDLKIIPQLVRVGPLQDGTANDVTALTQHILFVLDEINAEVVSLEVNAPGGNQPADGHVWHPGQDIPLQVHIVDDNGLPSKMELYYNRSGRGWESLDFLTPIGAKSAIIDLPLIDEMSVPLSNDEVGWIDIFFRGADLSGNLLLGGGNESNPYARMYVEPRYPTWISGESLGLDIIDNHLLPGKNHHFNFTISDDNGIESIDTIRLDLSKDQNRCEIEWRPWNNQIIHDVGCFIKPPRVTAQQRWQANTWDVSVDFELRWDLQEDLGSGVNIPSLKLFDENAPLGVGFTSINLLSWSTYTGVDLRIVNAEDKVSPLGDFYNKVLFIHAQDIIDIDVVAYYMGYDIPAQNLPFSTYYSMELIGNNGSMSMVESFNSDGTSSSRIVLDSAFYGEQIKVIVELGSISGHNDTGDSIDILIDNSTPILTVSSGYLVSIDSDTLDSVPIEATIQDGHGLNNQSITMHWTYVRQGRLIQSSSGSASIPLQFQNIRTNLYFATVDMNTSTDLQKGDGMIVWFDGYDASGREISGFGSSDVEPVLPIIKWIAYEPELEGIVTTPYRPIVGDIVYIDCTVSNIGLLDGESNLTLFDGDGKVIERLNFTLLVDMEFTHTFEIEAWTDGDLGLQIQIDGQQKVPVPISNVQTRVDDSTNSQATLLGLSVLSVFIAGLLLFAANSRRHNLTSFDEEE
jgi:hypothetical protein